MDEQAIQKYRPISLLPICGKVFEQLIYNKMFEFFIDNDLILQYQSGFKTTDSCVNQLYLITHDIYKSFDAGLKAITVFFEGF